MAVEVKLEGGKKLTLALGAIAEKIVKGGALKVGFLEGATYPPKPGSKGGPALSVAQVAFWNEYGTSRSPPRPFFRTTIAAESKTWSDKLGKALTFYKFDGVQALKALGTAMKDDLTLSIQRWSEPPNAPRTVARKGFNKPLVDTGTMSRAPDFELTE